MRVLITGGHFSPAYSLIKELRSRGHDVIVAGRKYPFEGDKSESFEYRVSKDENLEFYEVKTGRFQRKFSAYTITSLLKTPLGFFSSFKILSKSRPNIVLTFGGYVALPIALAAYVFRIPVILHEQTQKGGIASKIISKFAKVVCISFKSSTDFFPKSNVAFTGNPIRKEIFESHKKILIPEGLAIYITGGSTGSHFINSVVYEILPQLLADYVVIHQTGESLRFRDYEKLVSRLKALPKDLQKKYILKKFIYPDEIGDVFKNSDLIISRSGANIVFEIMATSKMSLLIPLPYGQNEEQLTNAKFLKSLGASEFVEEKDAKADKILNLINRMFKNKSKYQSNIKSAKEFVVIDAAKKIADIIEKNYAKKSN